MDSLTKKRVLARFPIFLKKSVLILFMCFWKKKNRELLILFLNLIKKNKNKKEQQYIKQFQQDLNSMDSIRTQKTKKKNLLFEFQTQLEKKQKFAWKEIKGKQSGWTSKWKYKLHKIDFWNKEQPSFNKCQRSSALFFLQIKFHLNKYIMMCGKINSSGKCIFIFS